MPMEIASGSASHSTNTAVPPRAVVCTMALFVVMMAALTITPQTAAAISRNTVLSRAQVRVDAPVKYSQKKYYAGYRTDCSGYVSMAWKTGTSWNTRTFHNVTRRIRVSQLLPGDALLRKGHHIRLFYGWVDDARTQYVAYESASGKVAGVRIRSIEDDLAAGYVPVRYNRITASPEPRNLLRNSSFNTWATDWSGTKPVWWDVSGEGSENNSAQRKDVYRTARNSLQLTNPASPDQPVTLSQTAKIVPGAEYGVRSWVRTVDPSTIALSLEYLDAAGASVAETSTTGDRWGINADVFKPMAFNLTAPPEATAARVTVWLAPTVDPIAGSPVGSTALVDDVSLHRPQVSVGIKPSKRATKRGTSITLSGTVTPAQAEGTSATLYAKRPGGDWTKLSTVKLGASDGKATWSKKVAVSSKARTGTHAYRLKVPALPGYLGATSKTVSVKVK